MTKNILVSGGAGYIGSHAILSLLKDNYKITVIDDMSTGSEKTKKYLESLGVKFILTNINNYEEISKILKSKKITTVLHFAGSIIVSESVADPIKYYENNFTNTLVFIKACLANNVKNFIFSSTASIYGNVNNKPVSEDSPIKPINPYAQSKLMVEQALADIAVINKDFNYGILRYFNVAGADYKGRIGHMGKDTTHLIKIAVQKALNKREKLSIFGTDYATKDGTCIRDYIHVSDLAQAHLDLVKYMEKNKKSNIFNCGYGYGYSVKEVIFELEIIVGKPLNYIEENRRPGDPVSIISNSSKIKKELNWIPKYDSLTKILKSALDWEKNL